MPTYEYECPNGHRYETREGFDAPATQKCPTCRKMARRVLFAPPIVFKGSGFYVTDSRKAESGASSNSDSKSESSDGATSDAKTESKADGKSEAASDSKADTAKSETSTSKDGGSKSKADKATASS